MRLFQIRVDIYEAATNYAYPIVTHVFTGKTEKEARAYHDAHRRADAFLRQCEDKGVFGGVGTNSRGGVRCRAQLSQRWITV